ncbi:hypothetical protein B0T11DRAFT_285092 [Plectosphaerella cucumerina]|uniref:Uncharacterized protein n=1 Tax=Plectosphaerella cucumerina TaxID=40658 RepID=A0A8K0X1I4_9PEZI|nr:hypothetical protein B0T11DRAFT_285092 [Plectosphaerella cucumerina]
MPSDAELSRSGDALMQRLMMAEAGIIRIPKKAHRDALVEDAYQAFSQDDVFAAAKPQSFKDFEHRRKSFKVGGTRLRAFREGGRFPQSEGGKLTSLAENLLDMCVRVLEAFAPKDLPALSVRHCFGALSSVLQDPTAAAALKDSDAEISDPDLDDAPTSDKAERWVISLRAQSELAHPGQTRCEDCSAGKVYKNASKAIAHLRRSHAVGLRADMHLKEYISTIQEASRERLEQDYREILLRCRKNMAGIAQKTARIQAGVIYQGGFKGPAAGLPPPLFKAFKLLVVFLCALPRLLDNVSWLYKVEVLRPRVRQLRSAKVDAQRQAVFKLGEAVGGQVHDAERVLASPELSSGSVEGLMKGRLMDVVGPSYVAMQVVHNILRVPVYGDKHVAELYDGYFKIQRSQVRRKPEKRLVLSIGALKDEMSLVTDFLSAQIKALDVVAAVLSPESRAIPDAGEAAAFEQLEMQVFNRANWHLTKQLEDLERIDKTLNDMDAEVRQRAEIMADQNSRAMMIFTVVTVFFLPPGFVAAYLSMGDGPDGLDFEGIQRRFWTIAGPLTATVWAVCIFLAYEGTESSPLLKGRAALGKWRAEREERREGKAAPVDEDYASVGELSV